MRNTVLNIPIRISLLFITDNILKGVPKKDWIPTVKKTISNKFKNGIPIKGRLIKVNRKTVNEYLYSEYTKNLRSNDKKTFKDKLRASNNLDEIIVSSINYVNEDLNHLRKDNIVQFARGNVLMQIGNNQYNAKVIIGFTSGNNMLLYDLINLTPDSFKVKIKKADTHTVQQSKSTENDRTRVSADISLPRNNKSVNEKFSVDEDTDEKAGAIHDTLKFSIDENKSKWLVNDDGKSVFDAVKDEKNPDRRISILYHYAGKTAEHGMSVGKDKRIGQSGMYVELNEKRTHTWLTGNGLQLPLPSFKYGFSEIIKSQNQGAVKYSFEKAVQVIKEASLPPTVEPHHEGAKTTDKLASNEMITSDNENVNLSIDEVLDFIEREEKQKKTKRGTPTTEYFSSMKEMR